MACRGSIALEVMSEELMGMRMGDMLGYRRTDCKIAIDWPPDVPQLWEQMLALPTP